MKDIYCYNQEGVYTTQGEYDENRNCNFPERSTLKEPPETAENEVAVFNEELKDWEIKPDFRGEVFYDSDGVKHIIDEVGIAPKDDWTKEKPLTELEKLKQEQAELKEEFDSIAMDKSKLELAGADQSEIDGLQEEAQDILDRITEINIEIEEVS